jgi:hypothetical protein
MGDLYFEEANLVQLVGAVNSVGLDAVVIGTAAAALHGMPITTQDIDLNVLNRSTRSRRP